MFTIIVSEKGEADRRQIFEQTEISIGRLQGNDLVLPKGNVSKQHARLAQREGRFVLIDHESANGTYVNRQRVKQAVVRAGDRVYIGEYTLRIEAAVEEGQARPQTRAPDTDKVPSVEHGLFVRSQEQTFESEIGYAEVPKAPRLPDEMPAVVERPEVSHSPEPVQALLATLPASSSGENGASATPSRMQAFKSLVETVAAKLGPNTLDTDIGDPVRRRAQRLLREQLAVLKDSGIDLESGATEDPIQVAIDELLAEGPLTKLLDDESVTRIVVNGAASCVVLRGESSSTIAPAFFSTASLERVLARLCRRSTLPLADEERSIERSLPGGFRLLASRSASSTPDFVCLLRERRVAASLDDLVRRGVVSAEIATFLGDCVRAGIGILVVSPGLDSAFDLLGALAASAGGRWITIEDRHTFLGEQPAVVRLTPAKLSGRAREVLSFTARATEGGLLVENLSGAITAATLSALSQGIEHVVAGMRAASVQRALFLAPVDLSASAQGYDLITAREALVSAFQLALEVTRSPDGRERVQRVCELQRSVDGAIGAVDIFAYVTQRASTGTVPGHFVASGKEPDFMHELGARKASFGVKPPR